MVQQIGKGTGKSSSQIDRLRESELQSSIFRGATGPGNQLDMHRLVDTLRNETQVPEQVATLALNRIRENIHHLGLENPQPSLVFQWLSSLLREQGYKVGESSLHSLALSLGDVEVNMYHPVGLGAGASQNPEATSQQIAERIKTQFAEKRVFQDEVIQAHNDGRLELLHLGAIDRPHDVFLTPDYLKLSGLPVTGSAPAAGPARRAHVLLAHLIRFSHELKNHFAGDIRWGYLNTLLLPYLEDMNENDMSQFVQQMLFEFAQLDVARGGHQNNVILDMDMDLPRQLAGLPATLAGGETNGKTYGDYRRTLVLFNEILLENMSNGDSRGNPFHSPRIVAHFNDPRTTWGSLHQSLMELAFKWGNPRIAFSYFQRDFGPLGQVSLNDPDFLQLIQNPARLRGFSSNTIALNLPALAYPSGQANFGKALTSVLELAVTAHRQKRLFISRLMAYGNRGPLQFLRHKNDGRPFLKIDHATQPLQLIGLAEAAALLNHSPKPNLEALGRESESILTLLQKELSAHNRIHKLTMFLSGTHSESVAYRFAYLDLKRFGQTFAPYVLRQPDQAHPIYTEGPNILAFNEFKWRERMKIEGRLHKFFSGHAMQFYLENGSSEDPSFYHKIYQEAIDTGISIIQPAPDLQVCMSCFIVFPQGNTQCPQCKNGLISPYGFCQSNFSPVHSWCLGKRSEWKIRHRTDVEKQPFQAQLPW